MDAYTLWIKPRRMKKWFQVWKQPSSQAFCEEFIIKNRVPYDRYKIVKVEVENVDLV